MTARYRNPWFRPRGDHGPEFYETDAKPVEYRGYLIYQRVKGAVWDVVRDGVCVTRRAGITGAKRAIDQFVEAESPGRNGGARVTCNASTCWCSSPPVRRIPSTGQQYTVQALPWAGEPFLFRYLYLPEVRG